MEKLGFNAELITNKGTVRANLELYIFQENNMYIIYCPALDLSAYGKSEKEARNEFSNMFRLHLTYCVNKNSLEQDLKKYGWVVRGKKQKQIKAPTVQQMLETNNTLQDIVFNKDYQKISHLVHIPMYSNYAHAKVI